MPFAAAALLHQTHVLFWPALLIWFGCRRAGWRNAATTALSYAGVTLAAYLVACHVERGSWSLAALQDWSLAYAHNQDFVRAYGLPLAWSNVSQAVRTWLTVITADRSPGLRVLLILEAVLLVYCATRWARSREPGPKRMQLFLSGTGVILLFAVCGVEGGLAGLALRALIHRPAAHSERGPNAPFLAAWLLCYAGFAFWWQPNDIEFLVPLAPALLLLAVCALLLPRRRPSSQRAWRVLGGLALLNVFATNLDQRILPLYRARGYADVDRLILAVAGIDDVVVVRTPLSLYIPYFYGRPVVNLNGAFWGRTFAAGGLRAYLVGVAEKIDAYRAAGRTVYVLDYPFEAGPPLARKLEIRDIPVQAMTDSDIVDFYSRYELEFIQRPEGTIARIKS